MIAFILSSPVALALVAFVLILGAFAVWGTDWLDGQETRRAKSLSALGKRAKVCAQGIVRLTVLHRQREAVAMQHAWANQLDQQFFLSSASVMGDYEVLYSHEALAIVKAAARKKVPIDDGAVFAVEHPTNPLGIEAVGRHLALIADRIETNDLKS